MGTKAICEIYEGKERILTLETGADGGWPTFEAIQSHLNRFEGKELQLTGLFKFLSQPLEISEWNAHLCESGVEYYYRLELETKELHAYVVSWNGWCMKEIMEKDENLFEQEAKEAHLKVNLTEYADLHIVKTEKSPDVLLLEKYLSRQGYLDNKAQLTPEGNKIVAADSEIVYNSA